MLDSDAPDRVLVWLARSLQSSPDATSPRIRVSAVPPAKRTGPDLMGKRNSRGNSLGLTAVLPQALPRHHAGIVTKPTAGFRTT